MFSVGAFLIGVLSSAVPGAILLLTARFVLPYFGLSRRLSVIALATTTVLCLLVEPPTLMLQRAGLLEISDLGQSASNFIMPYVMGVLGWLFIAIKVNKRMFHHVDENRRRV